MNVRLVRLLTMLAVVFVLSSAWAAAQTKPAESKSTAAAKAWTAPKTPWGEPDLQGTWTSDDCIGTPMNRPPNLGDKLYYTEQELAERERVIARQAANDKQEF